VLVLVVGKDLLGELPVLQEVSQALPDTAVIVVRDTDNPELATLAWDLGASYVLQPPQPIEVLPDLLLNALPGAAKSAIEPTTPCRRFP
jgi:hypothetical protein